MSNLLKRVSTPGERSCVFRKSAKSTQLFSAILTKDDQKYSKIRKIFIHIY